MQRHETQNEIRKKTVPSVGLRASRAVILDRGISDTTLWRWYRRGWIKLVNICGKNYVDLESLAVFDRRAAAGEFSKKPSGAAGASHKTRLEQNSPKNLTIRWGNNNIYPRENENKNTK